MTLDASDEARAAAWKAREAAWQAYQLAVSRRRWKAAALAQNRILKAAELCEKIEKRRSSSGG